MMAGYSETPLAKKLGIKENSQIAMVGAPNNFHEELGGLPAGAAIVPQTRKPLDLILLFVTRKADLLKQFTVLAQRLPAAGILWVAWPKKASGVATDLNFDVVQKHGLSEGLVDTKICAVNEVWSGLKFVYRLKDRAART
jgi:hypothetical protein